MGTKTTTIRLGNEAAVALLKEARRELENGAEELYCSSDEAQRPRIEASVEIIGRVASKVNRWPTKRTGPNGEWLEAEALVEFTFSEGVMEWIAWDRGQQELYVADLSASVAELGWEAEQVYLLHVLNGIVGQRETVAV